MKIAIFIYNRSNMYSGGQYHAYTLGKAIASHQYRVDFYWNNAPVFLTEFSNIHTEHYELSKSFASEVPLYDYVIVAPSGFYVPAYYERSLELASRCGARICLLNYESENWFNKLAPTQDDYRVWDYWRRILCFGGLVLSTTKEADLQAKQFYHSPDEMINFDVLQAPINSNCARDIWLQNLEKDGSAVVFVRRQHDYKGANDLLKISAKTFENRSLHVIFGGEVDFSFSEELGKHYIGHNVSIFYHNRISVEEKFVLLAKAQLLLFLSYFEGFGYPPVEAFAVGTAVVCYDLPVLRENLGNLPSYVPVGDISKLESCLSEAFESKSEPALLVAHAEELSGFDRSGKKAIEILKRNQSVLKPVTGYNSLLSWGPFSNEQAFELPAANLCAPYPIYVKHAYKHENATLIEIQVIFRKIVVKVIVDTGLMLFQSQYHSPSAAFPGCYAYSINFQVVTNGAGTMDFYFDDESFHREIFKIK